MKLRVCLGVKHILANEGECKGWNLMTPKCTLILGVTLVWDLWMFRALVKKEKNVKLGPQYTIRKVLERTCLKCPHIVHLYLICMSYDQKKGHESNWEFDSRSQILRNKGSNEVRLGRVIHHWKNIFEGYKILPLYSKKNLIWKRYERPKFWDNKSPNFETPTWESREEVTFGCNPCWEVQSIL